MREIEWKIDRPAPQNPKQEFIPRNSLLCWPTPAGHGHRDRDGGPPAASVAGLGSESAIDVKAARRFDELQRRAPIRAPRARKRAINTFATTAKELPGIIIESEPASHCESDSGLELEP